MSSAPPLTRIGVEQIARMEAAIPKITAPEEKPFDGGLTDYIARMDPSYRFSPHLQYLITKLEAVERGEITRLMIFMPPQHGKTRTTSELFPAWYMGRNPDNRVISASYGDQYAQYVASKVRQQLDDENWPYPHIRPASRSRATGSWGIRDRRGWFHTTSIGGSATGRGANLFIIDDPIKNPEEADSPTYRQKIFDWFMAVAYTRRNNDPFVGPEDSDVPRTKRRKAAIVIITTRWHDDDLCGRLLELSRTNQMADKWDVVKLPAIAEEDDQIGRAEGTPLFPEMHPLEDLLAAKAVMPERWWFAQYQQDPTNKKGGTFARAWFNNTYSLRVLPAYEQIVQVCDAAWKKGLGNSYSVIATWGRTAQHYDILDVWRARVGYTDLMDALRDNYFRWHPFGCDELYIEDAASGISAIQSLQDGEDPRGIVNAIPFSVAGVQQFSFVETATPFFKANRVRVPEWAPWKADWIREHTEYPTAANDDQPVTTAMALRVLNGGKPTRSLNGIDWSTFGRRSATRVLDPYQEEMEEIMSAENDVRFNNFGRLHAGRR